MTLRWWTRSQSSRTAALIPLAVNLLEIVPAPAYQRIALRAQHLRRLGLACSTIARALGITDKTAKKAVKWGAGQD